MHQKMHKKCIKIQFKDKKLHIFMVVYQCQICNFSTPNRYNYNQHMKTNKHLQKMAETQSQNVEKCGQIVDKSIKSITEQSQNELILLEKSPPNICKFCSKKFSRSDCLKRHVSVCKLNLAPKCSQMLPNFRHHPKE